jgi:Holliday junction DNA helicase RuvA
VAERDTAALTRLPGIGKKTAERIIIELRDKLGDLPDALSAGPAGGKVPGGSALGEATNALIALGYKPQEAGRMARSVAEPEMSVEQIIRHALQSMVKPK